MFIVDLTAKQVHLQFLDGPLRQKRAMCFFYALAGGTTSRTLVHTLMFQFPVALFCTGVSWLWTASMTEFAAGERFSLRMMFQFVGGRLMQQ